MTQVREMAKSLGIKTGGAGKKDIVRAIQRSEGNFDCYGRAHGGYCDQTGCLFYEDCIKASNLARKKTGSALTA